MKKLLVMIGVCLMPHVLWALDKDQQLGQDVVNAILHKTYQVTYDQQPYTFSISPEREESYFKNVTSDSFFLLGISYSQGGGYTIDSRESRQGIIIKDERTIIQTPQMPLTITLFNKRSAQMVDITLDKAS